MTGYRGLAGRINITLLEFRVTSRDSPASSSWRITVITGFSRRLKTVLVGCLFFRSIKVDDGRF